MAHIEMETLNGAGLSIDILTGGRNSQVEKTNLALTTGKEQAANASLGDATMLDIDTSDEDLLIPDREPLVEEEARQERANPQRDMNIALTLTEEEIRRKHGKDAEPILKAIEGSSLTERKRSSEDVIGPDLQAALAKDIATGQYTEQYAMHYAGGLPVIPAGQNGFPLLEEPIAAALAYPDTPTSVEQGLLRLSQHLPRAYLREKQTTIDTEGNPILLDGKTESSPIYHSDDQAPIVSSPVAYDEPTRRLLQQSREQLLELGTTDKPSSDTQRIRHGVRTVVKALTGPVQSADVMVEEQQPKVIDPADYKSPTGRNVSDEELAFYEEREALLLASKIRAESEQRAAQERNRAVQGNPHIAAIVNGIKATFPDTSGTAQQVSSWAKKLGGMIIQDTESPSPADQVLSPLLLNENYDAVRDILLGTDNDEGMETPPIPTHSTGRLQELSELHPGAAVISKSLSNTTAPIQQHELNVIAASMAMQVQNRLHTIKNPAERARAEQWIQDVQDAYPTDNRRPGNEPIAPNLQQESSFASGNQLDTRILLANEMFSQAVSRGPDQKINPTKEWNTELTGTQPYSELSGYMKIAHTYADAGVLDAATNETAEGAQMLERAAENMGYLLQNVGVTMPVEALQNAADYNHLLQLTAQALKAQGLDPTTVIQQAAKARTVDEVRGIKHEGVAQFSNLFVLPESVKDKDKPEARVTVDLGAGKSPHMDGALQHQLIQDGLTMWQGSGKAQTPSMRSTAERRRQQIEDRKAELREKYPTLDEAEAEMRAQGLIPPFGGTNGEPHVASQLLRYALATDVGNRPVRGYIGGPSGSGKTYTVEKVIEYVTQVKNEQRGFAATDRNGEQVPLGNVTTVMASDGSFGAYVGEHTNQNLGKWYTQLINSGVPLSTINRMAGDYYTKRQGAQVGLYIDELDKLMESDTEFADVVGHAAKSGNLDQFNKALLNSYLGVSDTNRPVSMTYNHRGQPVDHAINVNQVDLMFGGSLGPHTDTILALMGQYGKMRQRVAGNRAVRLDSVNKEALTQIFAQNEELINRWEFTGVMPTYTTPEIMQFAYGPNGTIRKVIETVEERCAQLGRSVDNVILAGRNTLDQVLQAHIDKQGPTQQLRVLDKIVSEHVKVPLIEGIDRAFNNNFATHVSYLPLDNGRQVAVVHPGIISGPLTGDYMTHIDMSQVEKSVKTSRDFVSKSGWQKHVERVWGKSKKK